MEYLALNKPAGSNSMVDFEQRLGFLEALRKWQRANLKTVIFGGYEPVDCLERLERLRDSLRRRGWIQAFLVADLETRVDEDPYRKSIRALRESDVNLLLHLKGCSEGGVTVETTEVLNDTRLLEKSVVLVDEELEGRFISEVVEGRPEFRRVYHRGVKVADDKDLLDQALGAMVSTVARRPPLGYFKTTNAE